MENDPSFSSSKELAFSFDDYLKYQSDVRSYNENNDDIVFFNESGVHAAIVINELIKRAIKARKHIEMFCGTFYLFRDEFCKNIEETKVKLGVSEVEWEKFDPAKRLGESLTEFFASDLQMHVVLQKKDAFAQIKSDSKWTDYKQYMGNGLLHFYQLDSDVRTGLNHFIVSGTSYRKENSDEEKTAMCSFNRPKYAKACRKDFRAILNKSKECRV